MSRCKRGSCKYRAAKRRHARQAARKARQRREALHVWTTRIARRFGHVAIIRPPIAESTASGAGDSREWGAAVALKAELNRHVLDQAPAMAVAMLEYKIAERGGSTTITEPPDPAVAVGNLIVAATKANRKLRRTAANA
jgi:putative transposase